MSLNYSTLTGNLVRDPELRYTSNSTPVLNNAIAVYYGKDRSGETITHFFELESWGDTAIAVAEFPKGRRVTVTGRLIQNQWEAKDGSNRSTTSLRIETICDRPWEDRGEKKAESPRSPQSQSSQPPSPPAQSLINTDIAPDYDDIPF